MSACSCWALPARRRAPPGLRWWTGRSPGLSSTWTGWQWALGIVMTSWTFDKPNWTEKLWCRNVWFHVKKSSCQTWLKQQVFCLFIQASWLENRIILLQQYNYILSTFRSVSLTTFSRAPLGLILAEVAAGHPSRYIMPGSEVDGPDDDVRLPAAAVVVVLPTVRLRLTCSHKGVKNFLWSTIFGEGSVLAY